MRILAIAMLALVSACGHHRTAAQSSSPPLVDTQWRLVLLGDAPVHAADAQHAAHLVFVSDGLRVQGSGGCNRITGTYRQDGDALTIDQVASTRKACAQGMETEATFLAGLERVRRWAIAGKRLTLWDEGGTVVATLEAVGKQ